MKPCYDCKKVYFKSHYVKNSNYKDKLDIRCKECLSINRRAYYLKNRDRFRANSKKYYKAKFLEHKEARNEYDRIYGISYRQVFAQEERDRYKEYYYNNREKELARVKAWLYRSRK